MSQTAAQITILDAGGQYCHLIARKVRELGVYADVRRSDTPAAELAGARGLIISGGPASVYDPSSPTIDPAILQDGHPVLGICYGQQLMAHLLGGGVQKGDKGEYGLATLQLNPTPGTLFTGCAPSSQIWMSHRDVVAGLPSGFAVAASTSTCSTAAIVNPDRGLYGVQFHPEVVHTTDGKRVLSNFVFDICRCVPDWDPRDRVAQIENEIRECVGDRKVFFFVSGGVDSTVAFTLCLQALGRDRVRGVYVDTGLMREGETDIVRRMFAQLGADTVAIESAARQFLTPLATICEPEEKRAIIGEEFVRVQERIIENRHLLEEGWILGQGTIYPDTIESGGTSNAAVIKTHHNRVPGIQKLIDSGRIVEPLKSFYKDEVREIGRELGLPNEFLDRHPFPGPGLAIRCLCTETAAAVIPIEEGWVVPIRSVGVQGDSRTYGHVLAIDQFPTPETALQDQATALVNQLTEINRVIAVTGSMVPIAELRVEPARLTRTRLERLRGADRIVRDFCHSTGFDSKVWQFPVVLIPLGTSDNPDSIVLRPIDSVDGMTAQSVNMPAEWLRNLTTHILQVEGIAAVFYDLTHKPPATIEWE
ncbi:MAG TPA: glutamine-hydrolyzing GMP synthase [Bryobacteraceae bacterium]